MEAVAGAKRHSLCPKSFSARHTHLKSRKELTADLESTEMVLPPLQLSYWLPECSTGKELEQENAQPLPLLGAYETAGLHASCFTSDGERR